MDEFSWLRNSIKAIKTSTQGHGCSNYTCRYPQILGLGSPGMDADDTSVTFAASNMIGV